MMFLLSTSLVYKFILQIETWAQSPPFYHAICVQASTDVHQLTLQWAIFAVSSELHISIVTFCAIVHLIHRDRAVIAPCPAKDSGISRSTWFILFHSHAM